MAKQADKNPDTPSSPLVFAARYLERTALVVLILVCPLLFFTNLTRNPYHTQITLLNIAVCAAALSWVFRSWKTGIVSVPRMPSDWPLLFFLAFSFISTAVSWAVHVNLRPGLFNEGLRVWMFTLVNCMAALYIPLLCTKPLSQSSQKLSIGTDILLAFLWSALWFGFQSMKSTDPGSLIWDTYGAFLWILALIYGFLRTRNQSALEYFHVIFAVAVVAGLYGIFQYMGRDLIWSSPVQPYGGRPVSTFGNPNFLSSYLMMVSPLAFAFWLQKKEKKAHGYLLVSLISTVGVLCTLTRSSYVGLLAGYIVMAVLIYRFSTEPNYKKLLLGAGAIILLILLFPSSSVSKVQSPLTRFVEIYHALQSGDSSYGAWYQRLLIWSSAWDMVKERPFLGKGWGSFELFYPFYQGKFLFSPPLAAWRTHANNAHNILMEVWSQIGTIGTGLSLWLLASFLAGGWSLFKRDQNEGHRLVLAALIAGAVAMVVDNFFGNVSIFFAVPSFLFWWYLGALFNEDPAIKFTSPPLSKALGRTVLLALVGFFSLAAVYSVKRWKEEVLYFDGFKAAKAGDTSKAIKSLERAFRWFDADVNNNYELGNAYARQARMLAEKKLTEEAKRSTEKAAQAYEDALRANPGYDEIYFNLGIVLVELGNKQEAVEKLETAVFINPLLRDVYNALGNLYMAENQPEKSIRLFDQAVQLFPQDKDFWNNLGVIYSHMQQDEKAYACYKKAYLLDPSFSQALNNLAAVCAKLNRREPLLEVPQLSQTLEKLLSQKSYSQAKPVASRLIELLPENPDLRLSMANLLFYTGEIDKCIEELKKAVQLRPNFVGAYINLGQVYGAIKQFDLARQQFRKALDIDPGNAGAKQALSSLPIP